MIENARLWLPDWFMALNAVLFCIVPLLAARIPATSHKSEKAIAKLVMLALSNAWWVMLFTSQALDVAFIENDAEVRFFLGRIGYLACGYAMSVYVLNGWVFARFTWMQRVLEPLWQRLRLRWKFSSLSR